MIKSLIRHLRRSPLDFAVPGGGVVGDLVLGPLDAAGIEPVVVDLGARNGMMLLPASYARRARLIGFEPNREEYDKLVSGTTDSRKVGGYIPAFKHEEYHPYAVWHRRERRPLHITVGAGACTLMGEADRGVTGSMYLDLSNANRGRSYSDLVMRVLRTEDVECVSLDEVIDRETTVDFLKLDVEGAELACLQGARSLLETHRALLIKSEFVTFPYYRDHQVFGAQHAHLNGQGYRLIGIDLEHVTYRRGPRDLPETGDRRLIYAGDGIYIPDPDRVALSPEHKQRLAAITLVFGFGSLALSLLEEAALTPSADIARLESALRRAITIKRLKRIWNGLPTTLAGVVRR